jgi:hypothetical protein
VPSSSVNTAGFLGQSLGRNRLSTANPHPGRHAVRVVIIQTCQNFCADVLATPLAGPACTCLALLWLGLEMRQPSPEPMAMAALDDGYLVPPEFHFEGENYPDQVVTVERWSELP